MVLPETEREQIDQLLGGLCTARTEPDHVRLRFEVKGHRVTLFEARPLFIDPSVWNEVKVAQLEFSAEAPRWTLYWYDRKNRRQPYPTGRNRDELEKLVNEIIKDPTGIFWE